MKTILRIFLTFLIVFLSSSCEEKNPEYISSLFFENSTITHTLDGVWDNGQVKITFNTDNAVFCEIKSGSWLTAMSDGLVDIGSMKIKKLKQESALIWSCNELVLPGDNISGAKGIEWNTNGKITMSLDGNSITITSSDLTMFTSTYTKSSINAIAGYPQLGTTTLLSVTANSASTFSNVFSDGGKAIGHRGVCWNTAIQPTISNTKTEDGSGKGTFNSTISNLVANTTYYLKAYATNENGTAYSQELTLITLPVVNNGVSSKVSYNTATISGVIPTQGTTAISAYGHCWGTSSNPTIENDNIISTNLNAGNFSSVLSGLEGNTKYYVRAFITNSSGTSYSNEITFITPADPYTVSDGLLAFYNFDTQNCNDALGNYNGVISGGISFSTSHPNSSGYAASFDGSTGYINIPYKVFPNTSNWSYSVWLKTNKNNFDVLSTLNGYIYISNTSIIQVCTGSYLTTYFNTNISSTLLNNSWHHFVVLYNGNSFNFYIDGVLYESILPNGNFCYWNDTNTNFKIGTKYTANDFFYSGLMDNIRFYNRVLTASEITTLYNAKQ